MKPKSWQGFSGQGQLQVVIAQHSFIWGTDRGEIHCVPCGQVATPASRRAVTGSSLCADFCFVPCDPVSLATINQTRPLNIGQGPVSLTRVQPELLTLRGPLMAFSMCAKIVCKIFSFASYTFPVRVSILLSYSWRRWGLTSQDNQDLRSQNEIGSMHIMYFYENAPIITVLIPRKHIERCTRGTLEWWPLLVAGGRVKREDKTQCNSVVAF